MLIESTVMNSLISKRTSFSAAPNRGRPNSCVTSRHFATGALLPNTQHQSPYQSLRVLGARGHTESVLFDRQLPGPRLVNVERRPSFRLPSASRLTDYCRICLGAPIGTRMDGF